jgi:hypothetical protein
MHQDLSVDVVDLMLSGRIFYFTTQKEPLRLVVGEEGFEPSTLWFVAMEDFSIQK